MARFQIIQPCVERGVPLPEVARSHGVALRTARRWVQRDPAGGLVALAAPAVRAVASHAGCRQT